MSDRNAAELIRALGRWQEAGGTWRVQRRTASWATVALMRCDGGEEAGRLGCGDPAWLRFLDSHRSSEGLAAAPGQENQ